MLGTSSFSWAMYCHTSSSVQFDSGNTRTCSPLRMRPLYSDHTSGRWRLGSHWPKSSRNENTRSLARARSSSRRAPPNAASNPCSAMASRSVTVWRRLRDARGPVSSATRPWSIESCTLATISRSPIRSIRRSRNSSTSGKLCPVSTCMIGNGNRPGRKAFSARRRSTSESLPPLNSSTGRSNSAATSRKMWIDLASSASMCESSEWRGFKLGGPSLVDAAPGLVQAGPASLTAVARAGARLAPDRPVALVVQRVVGQVALEDIAPQVLLAPVGQRVDLPDPAAVVVLELAGAGAGRSLLATDPRYPRVDVVERALERLDLRLAAAPVHRPRL